MASDLMAGMRVYELRGFPSQTWESRCAQLGSCRDRVVVVGFGKRMLNWQSWEFRRVIMLCVLIKMKIISCAREPPLARHPGAQS